MMRYWKTFLEILKHQLFNLLKGYTEQNAAKIEVFCTSVKF